MSMRSITPRSACSTPIGISVATACGPKLSLSWSIVRKKSARSRSSMFTKMRRERPSSLARCHRRSVFTSTPITPFTTNTALSQTRRAAMASATNDGSPGVSIRLTLRSSHWNDARLDAIDIWRAFSSGAESDTVVPSATEPRRLTAPASYRSASFNEVFPLPRWPTNATLRILSAGMAFSSPQKGPSRQTTSPLVAKATCSDNCPVERPVIAAYATVAGVVAVLGLAFWVVLEPRSTSSCNTSLLPGPYTDALVPLHLAAAVALGACAWFLSPRRRTAVALGAVGVYVLASLAFEGVFVVAALVGLVLAWPAAIVAPLVAVWRRNPQILVWAALLLVLPGHFIAAWDRGADWFCF